MVNFATRREEEPLFRELGLKLTHTEVIASIGTVTYPGARFWRRPGPPSSNTAVTPTRFRAVTTLPRLTGALFGFAPWTTARLSASR